MTTSRRFEDQLYQYLYSAIQFFRGQPIILGGVAGPSGGIGGPPGGFTGYLPQTRVAYDTSEIASSGIPISGMSLLDNLNHIRWDIQNINPSGSAVDIKDDGSPIASNVTVINFTNELTAVDAGGGQVNVTFSGGLDTIDNVNTTGKSDGQVLTWDNDISTWVASGIAAVPSGGVVNLDDLQDVNTAGKSGGEVLTWDGSTTWVASGIAPSSGGGATYLDNLLDVDTAGKTDGQVLTWDNDTTTWVASGISQSASSGPVVIENQLIFTVDSTIDGGTLGVLPLRLYTHDITGTIKEVLCAVNTVPASSGVRVDVMKNGTSILSSPNYVEIPVGSGYADTANIAISGFVKNDYFQIEIVREDSAAADLSVHVRYYWETS